MAALLPPGFLQFLDANGNPLSGGRVSYEDPASPGTPKAIYADINQTVAVQNPVPLDQAGRPFSGGSEVGIWGTGQYRMLVYDVNGALQWSAITSDPDSAALQQEINDRIAADNALRDQINAETNRAIAAEQAEQARATTVENNLINELAIEQTARAAGDNNLQAQINALTGSTGTPAGAFVTAQVGTNTTDDRGEINITFPTAFATRTTYFQVYAGVTYPDAVFDLNILTGTGSITRFGANGTVRDPLVGALPHQPYTWYATGF